MAIAPSVTVNEESPWPWLDAFDEASANFFNGRDDDGVSLLRMVRSAPVTVLFGKSGLGKTSLLQAGLFPLLRKERLLPIHIRLRYDEGAPSPLEQIWQRFVHECTHFGLSFRDDTFASAQGGPDRLWVYLHQRPLDLAGPDGAFWQPIFVLDQFEEIFTLGASDTARRDKFVADLGDLIENRVPRAVAERLHQDDDLLEACDLDTQPYKFLLSLREDYLPHLEAWADQIPRLGPHRYRLLPMTRQQALEAIMLTGGRLVTQADAERIVEYLPSRPSDKSGRSNSGGAGRWHADLTIEPALLSLLCSGLNAERIRSNASRLDTQNLETRGGEIIEHFYDERLADMPPAIRELIETELITPDGIRRQYPIQSAMEHDRVSAAQIAELVDRRILRIESVGDGQRLELVHDRLAAIALKRRQDTELREAANRLQREQNEAARRLKRNKVIGSLVAVGLAAIAFAMFILWRQAVESKQIAVRQTARLNETLENLDRAKRQAEENAAQAAAQAGVARDMQFKAEGETKRARAAERGAYATLLQAIRLRLAFEGPAIVSQSRPGSTLQGALQVLASHRSAPGVEPYFALQSLSKLLAGMERLIENSGAVTVVAFSPDGKRVISGSDDNVLRLWDADTGKAVGEALRGHRRGTTGTGAAIAGVWGVTFSPDGRQIVSGGSDGAIRLWDARTGRPIGAELLGHTDSVWGVAFNPDGTRIVSGSSDKTLRVWDARTAKPIGEPLKGHDGEVFCVAFSPDGKSIVSGGEDNTLRLWNADTGRLIGKPLRGHAKTESGTPTAVWTVAFSPDGKRIVSGGSDTALRLWDAETGDPIGAPLLGHTGSGLIPGVLSVAFSRDGTRIVSGGSDNTVRVWDAVTGKPIGESLGAHGQNGSGAFEGVRSVAFSPDGRRVVSGGSDGTLRLWIADTGRLTRHQLRGHTAAIENDRIGGVFSVAFSPRGDRVVSGGSDSTIRLWDAGTGEPIGEPLGTHERWKDVKSVAFSPDGKRIVSGSSDKTLLLWDADKRKPIGDPLRGHRGEVTSVAYSPDGKRIVSGDSANTLRLWDAATGSQAGQLLGGHTPTATQGKSTEGPFEGVLSVAYSPDGKRIVSAASDNTLQLWDAATGNPIGQPLRGHTDNLMGTGSVLSVAFSPDSKRVVSGGSDNTLRLWDAATGRPIGQPWRGHTGSGLIGAVWSVAFTPDGKRVVSGGSDSTLRLWDAATGNPIGEPLRGHIGSGVFGGVLSVAFSLDGKRVVSGGSDGMVLLWPVLDAWADELCAKLPRNMTKDEWKKWVGGMPYVRQCPNLPVSPDDPLATRAGAALR